MSESRFEKFYFKHYKKLMLIPIIILVLAFISIGVQYGQTGDFMKKDVSLKGGITATIYTDQVMDQDDLALALGVESTIRELGDFASGDLLGYIVEVSELDSMTLRSILEEEFGFKLTHDNYSVEETGPKLGAAFYRQLLYALLFAFILMGIAVFVAFRTLIPSLAVIFAAIMDIVVTLAIVNLFGMEISTAGIVAFLLVIGYSIDTDILLTTRVLRKKNLSLFERLRSSMKTGLTMTFTTIFALVAGIIFVTSYVIQSMFIIIVIALAVDIIATYLMNTGILVWYVKRKEK